MSYQPEFKGPNEGWTVNYTKQHIWRVAATMEFADILQEAYLVYLRVIATYDHFETGSQFMALYKRAWVNAMNDFSLKDTKWRQAVSVHDVDEEDAHAITLVGELNNDGHLATLLRQAPREVLMVLNLFLSAPTEIVELALAGWKNDDRRKTGSSPKICRLLGLDPDLDVMKMVHDYFQPQ